MTAFPTITSPREFPTVDLAEQIGLRPQDFPPERVGLANTVQFALDGLLSNRAITSLWGSLGYDLDPNFRLDQKTLDSVSAGLLPSSIEALGSARSFEHLQYLADLYRERDRKRRAIADMGYTGASIDIVASIADPISVASIALTGGLGALGKAATTTGRVARLIEGGLAAGAGMLPMEAIAQYADPGRTAGDSAASIGAGFGIGAGGALARYSNRFVQGAAQGAGAAAGQLAIDVPRQLVRDTPDRNWRDVMVPVLTNATLATVLGTLTARKSYTPEQIKAADDFLKATDDFHKAMLQEDVAEAGARLTPEGESALKTPSTAPAIKEVLAEIEQDRGTTTPIAPEPAPAVTDGSAAAGAASPTSIQRNTVPEHPNRTDPEVVDMSDTPSGPPVFTGRLGSLTRGGIANMVALVGDSPVGTIVRAGNMLLHDYLAKANDVAVRSFPKWFHEKHSLDLFDTDTAHDRLYGDYLDQQRAANSPALSREAFTREAMKWNAQNPGTLPADKALAAAVSFRREYIRTRDKATKAQGVRGADEYDTVDGYEPNIPIRHKIDELINRIKEQLPGRDHMAAKRSAEAFVASRIKMDLPKWSPEELLFASGPMTPTEMQQMAARVMARAWVDHAGGAGQYSEQMTPFSPADRWHITRDAADALRKAARELDIPADKTDAVVKLFTDTKSEKGVAARQRARINFDVWNEAPVPHPDTGEAMFSFKMADMMLTDGEEVLRSYSRSVRGAQAFTEFARNLENDPAAVSLFPPEQRQVKTIEDALELLAKIAGAEGHGGPATTKNITRLEYALRVASGRSPWADMKNADVRQALAAMRQAATAVNLSNLTVGANNLLTELPYAIAKGNLVSTLRNIPAIGGILLDIAKGLNNPRRQVRELIGIHGAMTEFVSMRVNPYQDRRAGSQATLDKVSHITAKAARVSSVLSGNASTTAAVQGIVDRIITQSLYDAAKGGKMLAHGRLNALGLSAEQWSLIAADMKQHVETAALGAWDRLNMQKWSGESAMLFRRAVSIEAARLAIQNQSTALDLWMSEYVGQIITQFRTYTMNAYQAKVLAGAQEGFADRDVRPFIAVAATSLGAATAYIINTYYRAMGRPDKDEYLETMLTQERIIKAGVSRSDAFGMLPVLIDSAMQWTGQPAVFGAYARGSQVQGNDFITGSPVGDLIWNKARPFVRGVARPAWAAVHGADYEFTQRDMRDLTGVLPNYFNIHNAFNSLAGDRLKAPPPEPAE